MTFARFNRSPEQAASTNRTTKTENFEQD
jgi:hypothetical protein